MVPTSQERELAMLSALPQAWCAEASLSFHRPADRGTQHQGCATAPSRSSGPLPARMAAVNYPCSIPAVAWWGDELSIRADLGPHSRALLTSVAAQKVYGSVGRSRLAPQGRWSRQRLSFELSEGADLEWLPQEVVVFAGGLIEQSCRVELAEGASWLGADVVRLGRSADAETLGEGSWRSRLEVRRQGRWSVVDQLELAGESLRSSHGLAGMPVFGSLVWAAPAPVPETLLELCRTDRAGLEGEMACGRLDQGLVARYRGLPARRPGSGSPESGLGSVRSVAWPRRSCRGSGPFRRHPWPTNVPAEPAHRRRHCQSASGTPWPMYLTPRRRTSF